MSGSYSEPGSSNGSPYGDEDAMAIDNGLMEASDGNSGYWFDLRDYVGGYESTTELVQGYVVEYSPQMGAGAGGSGDDEPSQMGATICLLYTSPSPRDS